MQLFFMLFGYQSFTVLYRENKLQVNLRKCIGHSSLAEVAPTEPLVLVFVCYKQYAPLELFAS